MMNLKQNYENVIIISNKLSEENIKTVIAKFKDFISKNTKLIDFQEWGKRKLAYPINYESDGYYVLFEFESDRSFPAELVRQYKIDDAVVRFMIVAKENKNNLDKSEKEKIVAK